MAVTGTQTVRQICTAALRKAGVTEVGESPEAEIMDAAREELDSMLKAWQSQDLLSMRASQSLTLTTATSYTLNPVRPLRILSARFKRGGIETPMMEMTRDEYDALPIKTTPGIPTTFYYDRQREAALFYVWPVLAATDGETVEITYEREVTDVDDLNAALDLPAEWYDATVTNLAYRMTGEFPRNPVIVQRLKIDAAEALMNAQAYYDEPVMIRYGWSE